MRSNVVLLFFLGTIFVFSLSCDQVVKKRTITITETVIDTVEEEEIIEDPIVHEPNPKDTNYKKYEEFSLKGKWGIKDKKGKTIIPAIYDIARMFSEGVSTVAKDNKFGLINEQGILVLPFQDVKFMGTKRNGLILVMKNDRFGFIDQNGNERIKPIYRVADDFSEGLSFVKNDQGKYGYINTDGKTVINFDFENGFSFYKGTAKIRKNGLWGSINKKGEFVEQPTHKDLNWH